MLKELLTMFTVRQVNTLVALLAMFIILAVVFFPAMSLVSVAKTSALYAGISALAAYANHQ